MQTKLLSPDFNPEPGCYVESGRGHYGTAHLIQQFSDNPTALRLVHAYNRGYDVGGQLFEYLVDIADQIEQELNDALPDNLVAMWTDGEFHIQPYCPSDDYPGETCEDDECGCDL
jgi:hypothetical protein